MRAFVPIFAVLALSGCTASEPMAESASAAAAGGGETASCIDSTRVAGRRAPDNRTLLFELADGATWRNDLQETCLGIERASSFGTLAVDPMEARLCRGDMVRVYDPAEVRGAAIKTAPRCRLGAFTRVTAR